MKVRKVLRKQNVIVMSANFVPQTRKALKKHKNKEKNDKKKSINNVGIQGKVCVTCGEQFNQQEELDTHKYKNHPKSQEVESDCKCALIICVIHAFRNGYQRKTTITNNQKRTQGVSH